MLTTAARTSEVTRLFSSRLHCGARAAAVLRPETVVTRLFSSRLIAAAACGCRRRSSAARHPAVQQPAPLRRVVRGDDLDRPAQSPGCSAAGSIAARTRHSGIPWMRAVTRLFSSRLHCGTLRRPGNPVASACHPAVQQPAPLRQPGAGRPGERDPGHPAVQQPAPLRPHPDDGRREDRPGHPAVQQPAPLRPARRAGRSPGRRTSPGCSAAGSSPAGQVRVVRRRGVRHPAVQQPAPLRPAKAHEGVNVLAGVTRLFSSRLHCGVPLDPESPVPALCHPAVQQPAPLRPEWSGGGIPSPRGHPAVQQPAPLRRTCPIPWPAVLRRHPAVQQPAPLRLLTGHVMLLG